MAWTLCPECGRMSFDWDGYRSEYRCLFYDCMHSESKEEYTYRTLGEEGLLDPEITPRMLVALWNKALVTGLITPEEAKRILFTDETPIP